MLGSNRNLKSLSAIVALLAVCTCAPFSQAQDKGAADKKKEWKDRAEYELYDSVTKSQDPNQWLASLDKWKAQYPQSDFSDLRRQLYLASYRALIKPREAFDAAAEVLNDNPTNLVALSAIVEYLYPLVPYGTGELTPKQSADLDTASKAAAQLRNNLDAVCSKENRPPDMTDEQVAKAKPALRVLAQRAIGYVALERRDFPAAQTELTKVLDLDPNQGQVSFWLGRAILAQNKTKPELQSLALFHFARAAQYDGAAGLSNADRQTLAAYLKEAYTKYHGSADGLDKVLVLAKASPQPPADFHVKTKSEIDQEKRDAEDAIAKANPSLGLWKRIRQELQREGGDAYFETSMKGAELPANANGVAKFKGKIVSMTPPVRPKELVLAIESPDKPDAVLHLDSALTGKMDAGAEIEFEGVADSFSKDPFMVTFTVEKSKIEGWAGRAAPAPKKSAGKSAAKKAGL